MPGTAYLPTDTEAISEGTAAMGAAAPHRPHPSLVTTTTTGCRRHDPTPEYRMSAHLLRRLQR